MNLKKHLPFFKLNQKLLILSGAATERVGKVLGYPKLKWIRSLFFGLEKSGYELSRSKNSVIIRKNGHEIQLRKTSSDFEVAGQVIIQDEYGPLISYFIDNNIAVKNIIDAGSNIGLTSIQFLASFPGAKVICIEPDPANFEQLQLNLKSFSTAAVPLKNALWHTEEILTLDFGFRDGKDWSRRVTSGQQTEGVPVQAVSLNKLIADYSLETIDILKIDIEGSEAVIFNEKHDLSFLDRTKVIAIEIHDEFNCREIIYAILKARNFMLFRSGELTIGVNTRLTV